MVLLCVCVCVNFETFKSIVGCHILQNSIESVITLINFWTNEKQNWTNKRTLLEYILDRSIELKQTNCKSKIRKFHETSWMCGQNRYISCAKIKNYTETRFFNRRRHEFYIELKNTVVQTLKITSQKAKNFWWARIKYCVISRKRLRFKTVSRVQKLNVFCWCCDWQFWMIFWHYIKEKRTKNYQMYQNVLKFWKFVGIIMI